MNQSARLLFAKAILAGLAFVFFAFASAAQNISSLNLPLYFEANQNQTEFFSSGGGYQFLISPAGVQIALRKSADRTARAQMQFVGANLGAQILGAEELPGKVNCLIGNDSSKWQTGMPVFAKVRLAEIYPGINLVFHGNQRQLEYDFALASGADPNAIKIHFTGVDKISISPQSGLILKIGGGEIRQPRPEIYQTINGVCKVIGGGYKMLDARTVAFAVNDYNHSLPLIIDPVLGYSAFFGGSTSDSAYSIAVGTNGCIYMAGYTLSQHFSTAGVFQTTYAGGQDFGDAFVAKFSNPATNLIYLTYLGGSDDDAAFGVVADGAGNAFVAGYTDSPNFPTTSGATTRQIPTTYNPNVGYYAGSAFVAELNTNGTSLIYSTYLGGADENFASSIAVDSSDNAYVTGATFSPNFPVTTNAFQKSLACSNNIYYNANAFVTEIASNDAKLVYSTYIGGINYDEGEKIVVDASNYVYVAGYTESYNFPVWHTPTNFPSLYYFNGITGGGYGYNSFDGFVTKFPPLATQPTNLVYSTFLGGTNSDVALGIAADGSGNAYVTGWTSSLNFPLVNSPPELSSFLITNGSSAAVATNVFLTEIASNGSSILNSAVYGGDAVDIGYDVAVDPAGDAFVTGGESSTNFPTISFYGSLSGGNSGGFDAFVTGFSNNWNTINDPVYYSVCLGGSDDDFGLAIAMDADTNVYVTGQTDSPNYPTYNASVFSNQINGASYTGTSDAFLTEIALWPTVPTVSAIQPASQTVGTGVTVTFSVTVTGTSEQMYYQWQYNGVNLANEGRVSGVNSTTLTISDAQPGDTSTNYDLVIWYGAESTLVLSNASLTVSTNPVIITSLTNQTVGAGSTVNFTVTASGSPLYYLWTTNSATPPDVLPLSNGGPFSGTTSNTLTITDAQPNDSGVYTVYVYFPDDNYVTNSATLTVLPAPDITSVAPANGGIGNGLVFSGIGGSSDASYVVLASTNLLTPINSWTPIATNQYGSQGQFIFTNPVQPSIPQLFFILEQQ